MKNDKPNDELVYIVEHGKSPRIPTNEELETAIESNKLSSANNTVSAMRSFLMKINHEKHVRNIMNLIEENKGEK